MTESGLGPIMMDVQGASLTQLEAEQLRHPSIGGVILFTRNYESPQQLADLIVQIRQTRVGLLIAADTEGGRVQRFRDGFIRHPAAAEFGKLWQSDPQQAQAAAHAAAWLLAAELRAVDIDLAFTPVLDIDTGSSGIIGDRALASESAVIAQLAKAYIQGMHAAGMAATGKHFPGHGYVVPDSHVELPVDGRSLSEIQQQDLQPYRQLNRENLLDSVMVAHVLYAAVDDAPASISAFWIQQQLRETLKFDGAVFSDDLSMGGLAGYGDVQQRCQLALSAGCDMLPVCNRPEDIASLLSGPVLSLADSGQRRLQRLRRPRPWSSLERLQADTEYTRQREIMTQHLNLEIAQ